MEDPQQSGACIVCNTQNALLCGRCKCTRYCSRKCQRTDFPIHKLLCSDFANFGATTRATTDHVRAILFPEDQENPIRIWVHCKHICLNEDNTDTRGRSSDIEPYLNPRFTINRSFIDNNLILARKLSDTICICYCDSTIDFDSTTNESIKHITATRPGRYFDWTGAVIAYGRIGLSPSPGKYRDLDMNDFRHITDYFLSCGFDLTLPTAPCGLPKVKAVRINCVGDRKWLHKPLFEQVELSANDPIFTVHDTSGILDRISNPVFTQRCTPHPAWERGYTNRGYNNPYHNWHAMLLHLSCDPKAKDWGLPARRWYMKPGSAIIVHQDKEPLYLCHAEALCRYCDEVFELFSIADNSQFIRENFTSMICSQRFMVCVRKMIREKLGQDKKVQGGWLYDV
ncbi:hypothetical protein F5B21DRAFT_514123 [Xylaria acuta]|nr:hypothetical protein F5B21DRAFT_514123 [Xylaria acuta]